MLNTFDPAQEYRTRAAELRALAEHMQNADNRLAVLKCAEAYDRLAAIDAPARRQEELADRAQGCAGA